MAIEKEENLPYMVIPVDMEDGTQIECEVLAIFPVGGKQYSFVPVGDEEFNIEDIEDDKEFELVEDAFNKMVESAEIDAVIDEKE